MKNILLISFALLCVGGCSESNNPVADDTSSANAISIANGAFDPSKLTISTGGTVTWTLTNGNHTVVSNDGLFTSGTMSIEGTYSHQFDTAGEFGYKCGIHSGMTGTIIVQ